MSIIIVEVLKRNLKFENNFDEKRECRVAVELFRIYTDFIYIVSQFCSYLNF